MDLNEQLDQNAADFSQTPPVPVPTPGTGGEPEPAAVSAPAAEQVPAKSVTKLQVVLVIGGMLVALGTLYYFLTKPAPTKYPKGYLPPAAVPNKK